MAGENTTKGLAALRSGTLSRRAGITTIGALEQALLRKFPAATAEGWDRTGLLAGDPAEPLRGVAVALDPTVRAVRAAEEAGANVLLTHHPAFLEAPGSFRPATVVPFADGAVVYEAVRRGVALMNFHTALDVSKEVQRVLPEKLGLQFKGVFERAEEGRGLGYGQVCAPKSSDAPFSLKHLAARCTSVFGRPPRVWGDFDRVLGTVVTTTGSAGDMPARCLEAGFDCLVCGEVKYHAALAAADAGLCIVDLGHDTSELPLCEVLVQACAAVGVPEGLITVFEQNGNWSHPEAVRR